MSNTKSGPNKVKRAWASKGLVEELCEKWGIDPEAEDALELLRAAMAAAPRPTVEVTNPEDAPSCTTVDTSQIESDYYDPLWWLDENVHAFHFVSRRRGEVLRAAREKLVPPLPEIRLKQQAVIEPMAWGCPFKLPTTDLEPGQRIIAGTQRAKGMIYAEWSTFVIPRHLAEDCYADPRHPLPKKAVINPEDFRGWAGRSGHALGKTREIRDPDPLREAARHILQRNNGRAFINVARHREMGSVECPEAYLIANPYGNNLAGFAHPVIRTSPDGSASVGQEPIVR